MICRRSAQMLGRAGLCAGCILMAMVPLSAQEIKNLGMVGIKSTHDRYLQAHKDNGETHASNSHRNEEETWFLWEVDKAHHIYALQNWSNGKFLSASPSRRGRRGRGTVGGCATASQMALGDSEKWIFEKSPDYANLVSLISVSTHNRLGANGPGHDTNCGGEVGCGSPDGPPRNDRNWQGWWRFESATAPSPGRNVWNTVGNAVLGAAVNIAPAAIPALLGAL